MALTVKIIPNDTNNPPGKLADAELHFTLSTEAGRVNLRCVDGIIYANPQAIELQDAARLALALDGLKLIGFAIWQRRIGNGRNVTFPARSYTINGERRSFALLRPSGSDLYAQDRIRDLILAAYEAFEATTEDAQTMARIKGEK